KSMIAVVASMSVDDLPTSGGPPGQLWPPFTTLQSWTSLPSLHPVQAWQAVSPFSKTTSDPSKSAGPGPPSVVEPPGIGIALAPSGRAASGQPSRFLQRSIEYETGGNVRT